MEKKGNYYLGFGVLGFEGFRDLRVQGLGFKDLGSRGLGI